MAEQIFKVFLCFREKPKFLSLEKKPLLNGGLLFLESIVAVFNYFKPPEAQVRL